MSEHQAVDFLRRRYANAILRDDMGTACRLREQLDGIMNRARPAHAQRAPAPAASPPLIESSGQHALQLAPRMSAIAPVTGLLERRRTRSGASVVPL